MKVILAKSAGFCFGVDRAVNTALRAAREETGPVYTYGELIHNKMVVEELESLGVKVIEDVDGLSGGTVIIRSHGVGKDIIEKLSGKGIKVIDATCPKVKSVQNKVEKYHNMGYNIMIVGDKSHPEVIGIGGWCKNEATVVNSTDEAEAYTSEKPVCIVAQTTIIRELFEDVCAVIRGKYPDAVVFNTICNATSTRQEEAAVLSEECDAMIVIGGLHSSNTKKLAQICSIHTDRVYHIESSDDINKQELCGLKTVGITAGASTPPHAISEVFRIMDNTMNFEELMGEVKSLRTGDIVTGEVIAVNEAEVFVNIGYKSDGVIKKAEFMKDLYESLTSVVAIGDTVEAMITEMNDGTGNVALSKLKVDEMAAINVVGEKYEAKELVKGKITKIVKGGVIVDLEFATAFMPGNQYGLKYIEDLNTLLGKEVEGRIIEFDREKNRVIFSRKVVLVEERNKRRAERDAKRNAAFANLELDGIITAPVKNITDFGLFLDLNGVDGFIHVSDISWGRIANPKKLFKVGDEVTAKVIELDTVKYRVKLSIKNITKEPWVEFTENNKVGDIIDVKIKNIAKFGAFAEIIPMVEGLIHVSNMAWEKVTNPENVVKTGDIVAVKIIEIDDEARRVGLSIKDTMPQPRRRIETEKAYYKEDSKVTLGDLFKDYINE